MPYIVKKYVSNNFIEIGKNYLISLNTENISDLPKTNLTYLWVTNKDVRCKSTQLLNQTLLHQKCSTYLLYSWTDFIIV
jgi:hypothetical protein